MSKVENFETKVYSDEDGWKIWLCTERTEWDKVESFFKVQYPIKGAPTRDTRISLIPGYYDNLQIVKNAIDNRSQWIHLNVGTSYTKDEYSTKYITILTDLIEGDLLDKIKEHNRKTLHQAHLLPGYRLSGTNRQYTVYHDADAGLVVNMTFHQDLKKGGYKTEVRAIMDINSRACKAECFYEDQMNRPESISNAVFKVLNTLLDEAKMDKEERMDIVSDITHYFNKGRFGFWHLLHLLNK